MRVCVIIPCFNHAATVAAVAAPAQKNFPVLVVDDGSTQTLPALTGCDLVRLEKNSGKGAALRAGFRHAMKKGFTHAITVDADGQHFPEDLPKFSEAAHAQPDAFIVGARDLVAAGCPGHRQRSNALSSFWFRVATGVKLRDTQCGFRCYPLALVERLKINSGRYAFELEFMVRAAWIGTRIHVVPVRCVYIDGIRNSHFRPVKDLAHITLMNIGLVLQSWLVPQKLRELWSLGKRESLRETVADFFSEHAHEPWRMACAVGLGLFFGIAPVWGFQMAAAATVAHWLRLNKAIALLASNISIPPMVPFIVYAGTALGHWMFTGRGLDLSPRQMTAVRAAEYFWQWFVGSFALGALAGGAGLVLSYGVARAVKRK